MFPETFSDAGCVGVARQAVDRCRRPGGRAPGRGDELPCLAGEVRLRSFGGGIDIPDQRPCIHDHRRGPGWFHWGEYGGLGHAGYLDAAATEPLLLGGTARIKNPRVDWLDLIGRVHPGTNPKALEAQLQSELHGWLASHLADMSPQEKAVWQKQTLRVSPGGAGFSSLREGLQRGSAAADGHGLLRAVGGLRQHRQPAAGARAENRQQTAVRVALGASRGRLVRNALLESVTLSLIGGAAGVAVAWAGARLILYLAFRMLEGSTWIPVQATPSTLVLLFALGVSLLTGAIFGMAPAWMTSHAEPVEAMRGANREVGGGRHWAQKALVIAQAAVSLVLLSAAAMLGGSLRNLEHQNFGFDPDGRYLVRINSPMLSSHKQEQLVPLLS